MQDATLKSPPFSRCLSWLLRLFVVLPSVPPTEEGSRSYNLLPITRPLLRASAPLLRKEGEEGKEGELLNNSRPLVLPFDPVPSRLCELQHM